MDVEYLDDELRRLALDPEATTGLPMQVVQKYRDRIALLMSVADDFGR